MTYADVEIRIFKQEAGGYPVEITVAGEGEPGPGYLDPTTQPASPTDVHYADPAYGQALYDWLFAGNTLLKTWARMRGAHSLRRIRLRIDPDAAELHAVPWEALCEPPERLRTALHLAAATATPFSRYLPVDIPLGAPLSRRPLRILVVAPAQVDFKERYTDPQIALIEPEKEFQALQDALQLLVEQGVVELTLLPQPCTLAEIAAKLQEGYHVLHLICHGSYSKETEQAALILADADNKVQREKDDDVAAALAAQLVDTAVQEEDRLRLVFLASCETAKRSSADAFRGLAPKLVYAGVPAVMAMQDQVGGETAREFARRFYAALLRHGQVDLAANQARQVVMAARLPGPVIPVLFLRLKDGRLIEPPQGDARRIIETKPFEPETVLIPGGPFLMGTNDPAVPPWEGPQHSVDLPDFRIGRYPVTVRQYAAFIKDEKEQPAPAGWFNREPPAGWQDHPVVNVSWHDALAYCAWLSAQTGRRYRLPSEAEWEKAGGGERVDWEIGRLVGGEQKRRYPWGSEWIDGRCNAAGEGTTAVTAHPAGASSYGVEDLLGNVQEWTRSLWGSRPGQPDYGYPYGPSDGREVTDPEKLPAQARLVHRGGSFRSTADDLRCSARGNALPDSKIAWRGLRVVVVMMIK